MYNVLVSRESLTAEEWHQWRTRGVGGSDASTVCGLNPYKSVVEVWLEKTGQITPNEAGEAAKWGTLLEPVIRDEFARQTGFDVGTEVSILQHKEYPYMIANLDGVVYDHNSKQSYIFEAKTCGINNVAAWDDGVPDMYQLQVQHYMAVTGLSGAYVAVLIAGSRFKYYFIPRDEDLINMLIQLEQKFWNYVLTNTQPPFDGSGASRELLSTMYPAGTPNTIILPDTALKLVEQHQKAVEDEKIAVQAKEEASNKLKALLGNNEYGTTNDRLVSWKTISGNKLDTTRLKTEAPDTYKTYSTEYSYRKFSIR